MKRDPPEGFVNKDTAAKLLGCTKRSLETYMKKGWLPFYKIGAKPGNKGPSPVLLKRADLTAFMELWRVEAKQPSLNYETT